jgi:urease accessory protein
MNQGTAIATLTQRKPANSEQAVQDFLVLSAEERQRSRFRGQTESGVTVLLNLPRGLALAEGDLLTNEAEDWWVRVRAKVEKVLKVEAQSALDLTRAAYHLGNRHVPLEVGTHALKLSPDSVLQDMLVHLGLTVTEVLEPFHPEAGAYGHTH